LAQSRAKAKNSRNVPAAACPSLSLPRLQPKSGVSDFGRILGGRTRLYPSSAGGRSSPHRRRLCFFAEVRRWHSVISLLRGNSVAFGLKRTLGRIYEYTSSSWRRECDWDPTFFGSLLSFLTFGTEGHPRERFIHTCVSLSPNRPMTVGQSMSALPGYIRRRLVPLTRARHRPRCQGNGLCSQFSYGQAVMIHNAPRLTH